MTKSFAEWALDLAPPWMAGPVGELYVQGMGVWHDLHVESAVQAVKARFMTSDTFHESGLDPLGKERDIPRFAQETNLAYRNRLHDAWNAWQEAGTYKAIVDQLGLFGVTAEIWEQGQNGPAPVKTSGDIWDWDDDTANWSRFFVVVTAHPWTDDGDWGDPGTYGDGGTWGTSATAEEVETVQGIITHWKAAHVVYPHVIVVLNAITWGGISPVTTGDRYDIPANRSDSAAYWDGYGKRAY